MGQFHGILTGKSSPTWPTFGAGWFADLHPGVETVNSEYFALPLPRMEMLRNRRRSRELAGDMSEMRSAMRLVYDDVPVSIVSHSNGAVLALRVARGMLDYALLVRPTRDRLIGAIGASWRTKLFAWPWGSLGADGWDLAAAGCVFPNPPETLDLPDMGHSDPVAPWHREWLYESVIAPALGLAPWLEPAPKGGIES